VIEIIKNIEPLLSKYTRLHLAFTLTGSDKADSFRCKVIALRSALAVALYYSYIAHRENVQTPWQYVGGQVPNDAMLFLKDGATPGKYADAEILSCLKRRLSCCGLNYREVFEALHLDIDQIDMRGRSQEYVLKVNSNG